MKSENGPKPELFDTMIDFVIKLGLLLRERWNLAYSEYFLLYLIHRKGQPCRKTKAILRIDLTKETRTLGQDESNISRTLNRLQDLGLTRRLYLTSAERQEFFPDSPGGNRMGIALTTKGEGVILHIRKTMTNPA